MVQSLCKLLHKSCKLHSGSVCVQTGGKGHTLHTAARNSITFGSKHTGGTEFTEEPPPSPTASSKESNICVHGCQPATFLSTTLKLSKKEHHRLCSSTAVRAVLLQLWAQCRTLGLLLPLPSHEGTMAGPGLQPRHVFRAQQRAASCISCLQPASAACTATAPRGSSQLFCNCNVH